DDALTGVMHLRHARAFLRAQGRATQRREIFKATLFSRRLSSCKCQVAVVDGLERTAFVLFNVATAEDPFAPQLRQAFAHIGAIGGIAVRAASVIDAHRRILFQLVFETTRWVLMDLAKRLAYARLLALDVNAARAGKNSFWF